MSSSTTRYPLEQAREIANELVARLRPYCRRVEIAGSIRREKETVGDVEIVCELADDMLANDFFARLLGAEKLNNGKRYRKFLLPNGMQLDLFCVMPPVQWGLIFVMRTGPADFSHWMVTPKSFGGAKPGNVRIKDGEVYIDGRPMQVPEEETLLQIWGLGWIEPQDRKAPAGWVAPAEKKARWQPPAPAVGQPRPKRAVPTQQLAMDFDTWAAETTDENCRHEPPALVFDAKDLKG